MYKCATKFASSLTSCGNSYFALLYESPGGNQVDGLPPVSTWIISSVDNSKVNIIAMMSKNIHKHLRKIYMTRRAKIYSP